MNATGMKGAAPEDLRVVSGVPDEVVEEMKKTIAKVEGDIKALKESKSTSLTPVAEAEKVPDETVDELRTSIKEVETSIKTLRQEVKSSKMSPAPSAAKPKTDDDNGYDVDGLKTSVE